MKTEKLVFASFWIILSTAFFSCNDEPIEDQNLVGVSDPGIVTNNTSLFGDNSIRERVRGSGLGGPMGLIYGRFGDLANGRAEMGAFEANRALMSGRGDFINARVASDSSEIINEEPETSCWVESYTETENSYEYILDFGEGCLTDGEFFKGKMIERGTFTEGTFQDEVEYIGFGGEDWEVSGTETFEGTWMEHLEDSALWEASYNFTSDLIEKYKEDGEEVEVNYLASGAEEIDNEGLTVSAGDEIVSTSTGESYESHVEEPLYLDFSCGEDEVWVFVSGLEVGEYTYQEDELTITGTYSIDFGDGTCDNLVVVTEDGVSEEIDIAEEWGYDEECDEEHEKEEPKDNG